MNLKLKARKRRHDEKVAVKVRHRLFDQREFKVPVSLRLRPKQMVAEHGLVKVRGDLGNEEAVVAVDRRLVLPRQELVQRMSKFMR